MSLPTPLTPSSSPDGAGAPRVLLVEDEAALAESVSYNLVREGFAVVSAADGETGLARFRADRPSIVILDLMLPKLSGLDVCRAIRAESDVPIVILTAKDSEADKVTGLELGADDYVTKPFSMRELVSRVRAHLRRAAGRKPVAEVLDRLYGGPVELDPEGHEVFVKGGVVLQPAGRPRGEIQPQLPHDLDHRWMDPFDRRGSCRPDPDPVPGPPLEQRRGDLGAPRVVNADEQDRRDHSTNL